MADSLDQLTHDHGALNARVRDLSSRIRALGDAPTGALALPLAELREALFVHFAREEEGLLPFVAETFADLSERATGLATAHDTICGALARSCALATVNGPPATLVALFDRFTAAYADHARVEAALLDELVRRLDADQRVRLATLVEGL